MTLTRSAVVGALCRYMSATTAHGILLWVSREYKLDPDRVGDNDLTRFIEAIETGAQAFLSNSSRAELKAILLGGGVIRPSGTIVLAVRGEDDIGKARLGGRTQCQSAGATTLASMQVATAIAELARNIVLYAGSGAIELSFRYEPERVVTVRAIDNGPGIANVDEVLGGHYHSKTGSGRGLLSVKRISSRFDIQSNSHGTRVEFEMKL